MPTTTTEPNTLRPTTLDGYQGHPKLKARLQVMCAAAIRDGRPLGHILLCGPPGSGKTTLGTIIANMVEDPFESIIAGSSAASTRNLIRLAKSHNGVLFIDEVHRFSKAQQELLLPLLEDGYIESGSQRFHNPWITIIAATTEEQKVIPPLLQRFWTPETEDLDMADMEAVVTGMASMASVDLSPDVVAALASAAGGMPRYAKRLVLAARDLADPENPPTAEAILDQCGAYPDGLTEAHVKYLEALNMLGAPSGVGLLSTILRKHESVCFDLERVLLDKGMIAFTKQGRELTSVGGARIAKPPTGRRRSF